MKKLLLVLIISLLFTGVLSAQELSLTEVISRSARAVENALPQGAMLAVLNFVSPSEIFSNHVLDALTGELVTGQQVTIVDRLNFALITQELNLHMSGEVSDDSALAIGRLLGAQSIVSGSLTNMGTFHRFIIRVISVETAVIQTHIALDLQNDAQVAFLLRDSPVIATPFIPMQQQARRSQAGFSITNHMTSKLSVGGVIGIFREDVQTYHWWNNAYQRVWSDSGEIVNWFSPTVNFRLLYSFENGLRLGLGLDITLAFFGINLSPSMYNLSAFTGGTVAPYAIIGHNSFSLHLGYDFVFGSLYLSPNFMITERLMLGIPVSLFGSNQRGTIFSLFAPPRERVNPPEPFTIRSAFQAGISIQYVF